MSNVEELLDNFKEAIQEELDSAGLTEWSIGAAGTNLKELLGKLSAQELQELAGEIEEGLSVKVEVDFSDALLTEIEEMLEESEELEEFLEDETDEEY